MENKRKSDSGIGMWKLGLSLSVFVLLSSYFVFAFSLGGSSAVNVHPGETSSEAVFSLMNLGDEADDIVLEATVNEGSQYISFPQTRYNVPAGEIVTARAVVSLPSNAKVGDSFPVKVTFNSVSGGTQDGGTISFGFGYSKSFDINVIERPLSAGQETPQVESSGGGNTIWWIIGIVVVILIIWWLAKRKKN